MPDSSTASVPSPTAGDAQLPGLSHKLKLWNLIIIGIVIVQPIAPMGVYGVIQNEAHGHAVTTILIAMVAMLFTASSYGKMASVFPSAGSAYTYVTQAIHPAIGYVTGWAMVMDYILNPLVCTVICAKLMIVVVIFFASVIHWFWGAHRYGSTFWTRPLYDPATFRIHGVLRGTSIAVLTYIGFDGI
jgi:putrescine importer